MIRTRSSSDGNGTSILKKNRSSCASGSGYVPSISSGFWVASTKNGSDSVYCCLATVTRCSCIASSSADCVFGGGAVDLVGEHEVAEDRSLLEAEPPLAALLDDDVRADDVGRHEVRRELDAAEAEVQRLGHRAHQHRLAEPGHALEQRVRSGQQADQRLPDELLLADDERPDLALDGGRQLGEALGLDLGRCGGASGSARSSVCRSLRGFQAREVVADEVLQRDRHLLAIERGLRVVVEEVEDRSRTAPRCRCRSRRPIRSRSGRSRRCRRLRR